ncbi:MAG: bifunctional folylpolyglutamate synthase/dihydrofolate synthase [Verrucomicrobiota bacterium]
MSDGERKSLYPKAIEALYELSWFGARLGLDTTRKLAELAGHPERQLRFIHVAGTNGKGSTCAMLESIYRATGLRVGLFTSPHLVSFRERIQVNRQMIPEADVVRLVEEMRGFLKSFSPEDHPTFFEAVTVMALRYFAEQNCDLVIWETGLGGRLDATNIVTPLASVITNIQHDHEKWLGETLASIAAEKGGIIKPGVPVITGVDELEPLTVITRIAKEKNAPLIRAEGLGIQNAELTRSLPGQHQQRNAAVALATVEALQPVVPVSPAAIQTGLARIEWPGRFQIVPRASGQKLILDGAHNVAGAEALANSLKLLFPKSRPTLILGILRDKDWAGMFRILAPLGEKILLVSVHSERTATPEELAAACQSANPAAEVIACPSLASALSKAEGDPLVVIAGSLYLIGEAIEQLGLGPQASDERGLNEWSGSASPQSK